MKSFLKKSLFSFLALLPQDRMKASILMYHSVGDNAAEFTVSPGSFERQLSYLVQQQYSILTMSAFVERVRAKKPLAGCTALTFDDGYRDMYEVVFPLLKRFNVPISIFISTGYVGGEFSTSTGTTLPMLTWEQIAEMKESGLVEFLPHGRMHHSLPELPPDAARAEIMDSVTDLEQKLGTVPRIYAYAKGKYSNETTRVLADAGFLAAVTVRPGYITSESPALELPRNHMDAHTTFEEFQARVRGSGNLYEWLKLGLWKRT